MTKTVDKVAEGLIAASHAPEAGIL
jgi:hypothetical protein